ncbi:hypothetical protein DL93DRAFT_1863719 [Clavulina sp. PMI_390]|nr:hypothetical protein DL93DRAFT_1863719 [Clavulina sp. PMI_390]
MLYYLLTTLQVFSLSSWSTVRHKNALSAGGVRSRSSLNENEGLLSLYIVYHGDRRLLLSIPFAHLSHCHRFGTQMSKFCYY